MGGTLVKNPPASAGDPGIVGFDLWAGRIPWSRKCQPTPVFLPGRCHGQRSLAGYSPWGCKESDVTEHTEVCAMSLSYCKASYHPCTNNLFLLKRVCVYVWGRDGMDMHDFTYYCQQLMA